MVIKTLRWAFLSFVLTCTGLAGAGELALRNPNLSQNEEGMVLNAEASIELGQRLEDALSRGVTLYFVREFEMSYPRWYWINDKRFTANQTIKLYYHALSRQYRVVTGASSQSFQNLEDALKWLVRIRNWQVIERGDLGGLKAGETYQASLKFRLDNSQLPKPLQINVLFVKDWELSAESRWHFIVAGEGK